MIAISGPHDFCSADFFITRATNLTFILVSSWVFAVCVPGKSVILLSSRLFALSCPPAPSPRNHPGIILVEDSVAYVYYPCMCPFLSFDCQQFGGLSIVSSCGQDESESCRRQLSKALRQCRMHASLHHVGIMLASCWHHAGIMLASSYGMRMLYPEELSASVSGFFIAGFIRIRTRNWNWI